MFWLEEDDGAFFSRIGKCCGVRKVMKMMRFCHTEGGSMAQHFGKRVCRGEGNDMTQDGKPFDKKSRRGQKHDIKIVKG